MYPLEIIDYIIVIVYLSGMIGVGLWFAKKHTDFEDFFLAGRSLTTPILITTLISTYYGIDVLFGDTQLAFTDGVVAWFGYARPTYAFFLIAALLLAKRLRKMISRVFLIFFISITVIMRGMLEHLPLSFILFLLFSLWFWYVG